jgi:N-acetylneuraminate synthase/sialic acid synthase
MADIERAVETILPVNPQLCVLQCTASYPTESKDMNLRVIVTFRDRFPDVVVGLSDHQNGIALAPVAYTLGARVIEKHFTLNRAMKGTDHAFSLEPPGMQRLVRDLRRTREALGDGVKRTYDIEQRPLLKMSKKLTAARPLPAGHLLAPADFSFQSPGDGLDPSNFDRLVGMVLVRPIDREEPFTLDHVSLTSQVEVR